MSEAVVGMLVGGSGDGRHVSVPAGVSTILVAKPMDLEALYGGWEDAAVQVLRAVPLSQRYVRSDLVAHPSVASPLSQLCRAAGVWVYVYEGDQ
jgi:hypothetical protein